MATSVVNPRAQFFADNGRPLIGGRIHTHVAGSSTRARTYKDAAKAQPNTNPIILDGRGEAQIYLAEGVEYKFVVEDSKGALIYTQEPVYGAIWPNAEQWPSDATLAYQYMSEAKAAAEGSVLTYAPFDTFAQLQVALPSLADGIAEVSRDETRGNSRVRYRVTSGGAVFLVNLDQLRLDLASDSGAQNVSHNGETAASIFDSLLQVKETFYYCYAPAGDGTQTLQNAVNAWEENPNLTIRIVGAIDVQGTVQVPNKETDNPEKRLTISGGSLKKTNAGFMFTRPDGQSIGDLQLQTGHITFDNVRFLGPRTTAGTYILDGDNIIRAKFVNCCGDGIQIVYAEGYLQSIYVDTASVFRKWSGWLFDCGHLFDVKFYGAAEVGGGFMRTRDANADPAANSLTVRGCIEGLSGKVFEIGVCFGVVIDGSYHEANAGGDYDFSIGAGYHKGLTLIGNGFQPNTAQLADPDYYPVKLGKGAPNSITLIGNSSTGNLFDIDIGNQSAVVDIGNFCPVSKKKFSRVSRLEDSDGVEKRFRLANGYGIGLHSYYSKVGFENTRGVVSGESVTAGIVYGDTNPQTNPGDYAQKNWKAGTLVLRRAPLSAQRQYGSEVHFALLLGWTCVGDGAPGTWIELAILQPY